MKHSLNKGHKLENIKDTIPTGGGISQVFEDVTALPDNPDGQKIYRVKATGTYKVYLFDDVLKDMGAMIEQEGGSFNFIVVDSLPDNPKDAMDDSSMTLNFYIVGEDIYGYNITGDNTWLSNNELAIMMGGDGYGGFITSTDDTSELTAGYLYLQRVSSTSYSYINVVDGIETVLNKNGNSSEEEPYEYILSIKADNNVSYTIEITEEEFYKIYNNPDAKIKVVCDYDILNYNLGYAERQKPTSCNINGVVYAEIVSYYFKNFMYALFDFLDFDTRISVMHLVSLQDGTHTYIIAVTNTAFTKPAHTAGSYYKEPIPTSLWSTSSSNGFYVATVPLNMSSHPSLIKNINSLGGAVVVPKFSTSDVFEYNVYCPWSKVSINSNEIPTITVYAKTLPTVQLEFELLVIHTKDNLEVF